MPETKLVWENLPDLPLLSEITWVDVLNMQEPWPKNMLSATWERYFAENALIWSIITIADIANWQLQTGEKTSWQEVERKPIDWEVG